MPADNLRLGSATSSTGLPANAREDGGAHAGLRGDPVVPLALSQPSPDITNLHRIQGGAADGRTFHGSGGTPQHTSLPEEPGARERRVFRQNAERLRPLTALALEGGVVEPILKRSEPDLRRMLRPLDGVDAATCLQLQGAGALGFCALLAYSLNGALGLVLVRPGREAYREVTQGNASRHDIEPARLAARRAIDRNVFAQLTVPGSMLQQLQVYLTLCLPALMDVAAGFLEKSSGWEEAGAHLRYLATRILDGLAVKDEDGMRALMRATEELSTHLDDCLDMVHGSPRLTLPAHVRQGPPRADSPALFERAKVNSLWLRTFMGRMGIAAIRPWSAASPMVQQARKAMRELLQVFRDEEQIGRLVCEGGLPWKTQVVDAGEQALARLEALPLTCKDDAQALQTQKAIQQNYNDLVSLLGRLSREESPSYHASLQEHDQQAAAAAEAAAALSQDEPAAQALPPVPEPVEPDAAVAAAAAVDAADATSAATANARESAGPAAVRKPAPAARTQAAALPLQPPARKPPLTEQQVESLAACAQPRQLAGILQGVLDDERQPVQVLRTALVAGLRGLTTDVFLRLLDNQGLQGRLLGVMTRMVERCTEAGQPIFFPALNGMLALANASLSDAARLAAMRSTLRNFLGQPVTAGTRQPFARFTLAGGVGRLLRTAQVLLATAAPADRVLAGAALKRLAEYVGISKDQPLPSADFMAAQAAYRRGRMPEWQADETTRENSAWDPVSGAVNALFSLASFSEVDMPAEVRKAQSVVAAEQLRLHGLNQRFATRLPPAEAPAQAWRTLAEELVHGSALSPLGGTATLPVLDLHNLSPEAGRYLLDTLLQRPGPGATQPPYTELRVVTGMPHSGRRPENSHAGTIDQAIQAVPVDREQNGPRWVKEGRPPVFTLRYAART